MRRKYSMKAELQRAKRPSGAPWVRKFGKPMKPKKFGYQVSVRARARPPARPPARQNQLKLGGEDSEPG